MVDLGREYGAGSQGTGILLWDVFLNIRRGLFGPARRWSEASTGYPKGAPKPRPTVSMTICRCGHLLGF